jgi:hypothetical protein
MGLVSHYIRDLTTELSVLDIATIGLTDLRSRVTIIPQDPTILSGTLRSTLDVFDEYDDADIYESLRRVHLLKSGDVTGTAAVAEDDALDQEGRNRNVFRDLSNPVRYVRTVIKHSRLTSTVREEITSRAERNSLSGMLSL